MSGSRRRPPAGCVPPPAVVYPGPGAAAFAGCSADAARASTPFTTSTVCAARPVTGAPRQGRDHQRKARQPLLRDATGAEPDPIADPAAICGRAARDLRLPRPAVALRRRAARGELAIRAATRGAAAGRPDWSKVACARGRPLGGLGTDLVVCGRERLQQPDHGCGEVARPARPLAFEAQQLEQLEGGLAVAEPSKRGHDAADVHEHLVRFAGRARPRQAFGIPGQRCEVVPLDPVAVATRSTCRSALGTE